jgi:hypothetical protein
VTAKLKSETQKGTLGTTACGEEALILHLRKKLLQQKHENNTKKETAAEAKEQHPGPQFCLRFAKRRRPLCIPCRSRSIVVYGRDGGPLGIT